MSLKLLKTKILVLLVLSIAQGSLDQNIFQKTFTNGLRSSRKDLTIKLSGKDNNEVLLPVSIIKGKTDGPVFTIIAGIHGFEYPPIVATQELLKEINPERLTGTLIIIPIANKGSFYTRTPFINPQDQKNLNNAFPGKVDGTITEQIAHFITSNVIAVSDVVLDIHGGDASEDLLPFVCYYNNSNNPKQTALAKKLSLESGFEYVISYPYTITKTDPAKYAFKQAVQDGKTALSIECGKLGNVQKDNVALIKTAVYNMLGTMQMHSPAGKAHKNIIYGNDQKYINATTQGIFYSYHKAGDVVNKGDIVGYTTDEFGNKLEEYQAIQSGIILYMTATPPINPGDTVMCISAFNK